MKRSLLCGLFLAVFAAPPVQAGMPASDTVTTILVDGDMREDWPSHGIVAFHREKTGGPLTVNFSVGGNAVPGPEYTLAGPNNSVVIPDGEQEAWVEFSPTGAKLRPASKSIVVTCQPGPGYVPSSSKALATATISLASPSPLPNDKAAVRFLLQAGMGPDGNLHNVREVTQMGFSRWIDAQFAKPIGRLEPYLNHVNLTTHGQIQWNAKDIAWWGAVMNDSGSADPLRQRIGFALSEMFVISDKVDALNGQPIGMGNYYDMLLAGAFGNYRTLLYNVGMHPCMGVYLSHLQNLPPDPAANTFSDENFAREVMQLFSIGIWELNEDGTRVLDPQGQPIPTYDNTTIANMARVMTGFSFGGRKGKDFWFAPEDFVSPMRMWDTYHDLNPKTIVGGVQLPARTASNPDLGTAGMLDYNAAVDALFNHPNCPPFVSRQLIQKLVTSNPSPGYVKRVADVFVNNGRGVRGDLKAVIRAILLDSEARDPGMIYDPVLSVNFGKMKEPYLRTVNLMRALNARSADGFYNTNYIEDIHYQQPLSAPSVFNFFKPGYAPAGPVSNAGLVAPEFQILNAVTVLAVPSYYFESLTFGFNRWGSSDKRALIMPDLRPELALAEDVPALMRRLDLLLTGGILPKEQHEVIREAVEQVGVWTRGPQWDWQAERVRLAIYLIAGAPEYGILR